MVTGLLSQAPSLLRTSYNLKLARVETKEKQEDF